MMNQLKGVKFFMGPVKNGITKDEFKRGVDVKGILHVYVLWFMIENHRR